LLLKTIAVGAPSLQFLRQRFNWSRDLPRGSVAQSVEQRPFKALVLGSSPSRPKSIAMDLSTFANLINAIAVTAGVIFAATQIREFRAQHRVQSIYTLVQSFQNAEFAKALRWMYALPENLDRAALRAQVATEGEDLFYYLMTTWESIGVLVFRGELTLELVDDFFSGPVVVLGESCAGVWRKCPWRRIATQSSNGFNGSRSV
jgi:hypothetical protein